MAPVNQEVWKALDQTHSPGDRYQKQEELQSYNLKNKDQKHRNLDKMRWQRNIIQSNEKDKTSEEQLSKVERGNLLDEKEFREIIKMSQNLTKRMEAQTKKIQEMWNKKLEQTHRDE